MRLPTLALLLVLGLDVAVAAQPRSPLAPAEIYTDGFHDLRGIAVDTRGNVLVSDRSAGTVTQIAPDRSATVLASGLGHPTGLVLDGGGQPLVAEERAGRVVRIEPGGALTTVLGDIWQPRWLAARQNGAIYTAARGLVHGGTVQPYDESAEPEVILSLVPGGSGAVFAEGFRSVQGLSVVDDAISAATRGRQGESQADGVVYRIPILADGNSGDPVSLGPPDALKKPIGVAHDRLGALWITTSELGGEKDKSKRVIAKLHATGVLTLFADDLDEPQGLAFDSSGSLYLADGSAVIRFAAPPRPIITSPGVTRDSLFTMAGITVPGARVDIFQGGQSSAVATVTTSPDGHFSASVEAPPNTTTLFLVFATPHNGQGLTSPPAEAAITHDRQAPTLSFVTPSEGAHVRGSVGVEARAFDVAGQLASLALLVDGQPIEAFTTPPPPALTLVATSAWDTSGLADGAHTLGAIAVDQAGNTTSTTRVVIVDNTPPETVIDDTPGQTGEIFTDTISFTFTGSDNLTTPASLRFSWRLDAGVWSALSTAATAGLSGLAPGPHTFEVKSVDRAGNEDPTPAVREFSVRLGPVITGLTPDAGPVGSLVTITGANFRSEVAVTFNGVAAAVRTATQNQISTAVPIEATSGPLTVRTTHGTATRPFAVTPTGDFGLAVSPTPPSTARVLAGDQTSINITAIGSGSFANLIALSLSTPLAGVTATFAPSQHLAPGTTTFLTLLVASTVEPGTYNFTITGTAELDGRAVTRSALFTLEVLPPNTTAITGRVLTAASVPEPIVGATITLGSAFTLTDAAGNFILLSPPAGLHMLQVDGRTASTTSAQYPLIEVRVDVMPVGLTRLPFVLYLPALDTAHPISLSLDPAGFTTREVRATTPSVPGLIVTVPPGSKIVDAHGDPVAQLTITSVAVDRTPMPFPPDITPAVLFTIQPGGAVPSQPLPMTFPNVRHATPGSRADLYFFDLAAGNWAIWGTGTVSQDGTQITSDPGFGLPRLAWHTYCDESCQAPLATEAPPAENQPAVTAGEPVDLFTGRFVVNKTDLLLPGRIPIRVDRIYWSGLRRAGLFGPGWNLGIYDSRLATRGTALTLIQPDQSQLIFAPDGPGRWRNRTAPWLQGATITQLPGDFNFQVRLKDGTIQRFDRLAGFANLAALSSMTDRNGNVVTITREGANPSSFGRITAITEPAGRTLTLAYDNHGRIVAVSDPLNRVVRYAYDSAGQLEAVTDPAGGITRYLYDTHGRITSVVDPRGIMFLTNTYDAAGKITGQTQADGGRWSFEYLSTGHGVTQTIVRDPLGHPTTYRFSSLGFPLATTNALGQTTRFEYLPESNLLTAIIDPLGRPTRLAYDSRGALIRLTDATGNSTTLSYDDVFGTVDTVTGPLGHTTRLEHDERGNVVAIVDATGGQTTVTSDAMGQPISVTDPMGNTVTYGYDTFGNPIAIVDPLGHVTRLRYDAGSRLTARIDARHRTTVFTYDALNHLVSVLDPGGRITRMTYDANGNLVTLTDPNDRTTTHSHDVMDRLLSRTYPGGDAERYEYDVAGNLVRYTDRRGHTVAYSHDALGHRIVASHNDGSITHSVYDALGRLVELDDSRGGSIQYVYDPSDRLQAQMTRLGTVEYTYDALDRRTRLSVPGVSPVTYEYDENSRLIRVQHDHRAIELQYDAAGRRTDLSLPNGVRTSYEYDSASRLIGISHHTPNGLLGTLIYTLDGVGNVTTMGGTLARSALPPKVGNSIYDAEDRQLAFGPENVTYDANGHPTIIAGPTGTTLLEWDGRSRLVRLLRPDLSASFSYDATGRRTAKILNEVTTEFLYDGPDIAQEIVQGSVISYLRLPFVDAPIARGDSDYYLTDRLGSIVALTDATGELTTRYVSDPFGLTAVEGTPSDNPLQFVARENDGTGLLYYRARYYSPTLHRFLGPDPLPGLGVNRYAYVGNNPVNAVDPFGLETILVNGGSPSFGPGGSSAGVAPVNQGLSQIAARLERRGEKIVAIFNSGQTEMALQQACRLKRGGRPVFLVGHSWGGRAALGVARRLVTECGMTPDHVFTIDPFEAPDAKAPPGVPVTNFYQRRTWWFQAPEINGALANILVPGALHLDITEHAIVKDTIEQTIFEGRSIGQPLGGRY